jgi:hypothetical protein
VVLVWEMPASNPIATCARDLSVYLFRQQALKLVVCVEEDQAVPNCDFYAAPGDFEPILQFVFEEMECRVFQAYSRVDSDLKEFSRLDELVHSTELKLGDCSNRNLSCSLMLWPVQASDQVQIRRIELNPAARLGTHKHTVEGWGLISLQLGGLGNMGVHPSHTNHNSENRARKWADTYKDTMGDPSAWDWDVVTRTSAKLNRRIHSLATTKLRSRPVLPAAKEALDSGMSALSY